uniref:Uncharacterized protein n=1 Tax=Picea sitchensis TaxID=3332 RepID=D5A8N8_PICSI|nr:unknown [Picea sitchensis]
MKKLSCHQRDRATKTSHCQTLTLTVGECMQTLTHNCYGQKPLTQESQ